MQASKDEPVLCVNNDLDTTFLCVTTNSTQIRVELIQSCDIISGKGSLRGERRVVQHVEVCRSWGARESYC